MFSKIAKNFDFGKNLQKIRKISILVKFSKEK